MKRATYIIDEDWKQLDKINKKMTRQFSQGSKSSQKLIEDVK